MKLRKNKVSHFRPTGLLNTFSTTYEKVIKDQTILVWNWLKLGAFGVG